MLYNVRNMINLKELNQSPMPAQEKMQQSLKVFDNVKTNFAHEK